MSTRNDIIFSFVTLHFVFQMTVPFRYEWLDEMFKEIATFVLFVLTGYKFRPASANPYFRRPEDIDEMDIM